MKITITLDSKEALDLFYNASTPLRVKREIKRQYRYAQFMDFAFECTWKTGWHPMTCIHLKNSGKPYTYDCFGVKTTFYRCDISNCPLFIKEQDWKMDEE